MCTHKLLRIAQKRDRENPQKSPCTHSYRRNEKNFARVKTFFGQEIFLGKIFKVVCRSVAVVAGRRRVSVGGHVSSLR